MQLHARQGIAKNLDNVLKRRCQERFEELGGTRDEFIRLIGKSYL